MGLRLFARVVEFVGLAVELFALCLFVSLFGLGGSLVLAGAFLWWWMR